MQTDKQTKQKISFGIKFFKLFAICILLALGLHTIYCSIDGLKYAGEYLTDVGSCQSERYNCTTVCNNGTHVCTWSCEYNNSNYTFDNPEYESLAQWHVDYTLGVNVVFMCFMYLTWGIILLIVAYILYHTWAMREFTTELWDKLCDMHEKWKTKRKR